MSDMTLGQTVHIPDDYFELYGSYLEGKSLRVLTLQGGYATCSILPVDSRAAQTVQVKVEHLKIGRHPGGAANTWGPAGGTQR
ncbi:hypothetical protein HGRIS_012186 [Hohenbuehelia grisea]|uniref:Uncharacterized protein n=1 Tax=Hohenbuehelia grisea TaxID=104357 RepID=A0ABR3IRG9_9AGAR